MDSSRTTKIIRISLRAYRKLREIAFIKEKPITGVIDEYLGITYDNEPNIVYKPRKLYKQPGTPPEESKGSIFDKYGNN